MSDLEMRHPSDEQLLRYADGELPAREAAQVRRHLEACWQCRSELNELEDTVARCVRYRRDVLQPGLPPPGPWGDIYRKFDEVELSATRASWVRRFRSFRLPGRWIPVAVTVALLFGVYVRFRETPSVQAAELLERAVTAAERRPSKPRRVQIRTSKHRITRVLHARPQPAPAPETSKEIQSLFELANYSWEDPLSARSFQSWREQLREKDDEVVAIHDGQRIRTTTESGELSEATLTLKGRDLQAVEGTLRFRNAEFVEITELPGLPEPARPMVASAEAPRAREASARRSIEPPPARATVADELHVVARLHQLGADLGETIEVTREGGKIVVTGTGIGGERQREIASALETLPQVVVRFADPSGERVPMGPAPSPAAGPHVEARLDKALEQRATALLDSSDALMARVYALRRLAQRFPEHVESELGVEERLMLARLRGEHAAALRARAAEMYGLLSPVLRTDAGKAAPARPPALPSGWQPAAEELFRRARVLERLLAAALGGAPPEAPADQLANRLMTHAMELRAAAEAYEDIAKVR